MDLISKEDKETFNNAYYNPSKRSLKLRNKYPNGQVKGKWRLKFEKLQEVFEQILEDKYASEERDSLREKAGILKK